MCISISLLSPNHLCFKVVDMIMTGWQALTGELKMDAVYLTLIGTSYIFKINIWPGWIRILEC